MKNRFVLSVAVTLLYSAVCLAESPDGWYRTRRGAGRRIAGKAIVTPADFAALRLDSLPDVRGRWMYQIVGRLTPDGTRRFSRATGRAVGEQIAFLFADSILCTPQVNQRIDGGTFAVSFRPGDGTTARAVYESLLEQMSRQP